jgi:hypothetical protein
VRNVGYKFVRPGRNGLSSRDSDQDLDQEGDQIPQPMDGPAVERELSIADPGERL